MKEYVVHEPTDFAIRNERVLGYVVLFGDGSMKIWTKPFDLSGNQHVHNMLFLNTVAFIHVPITMRDYFHSEWELHRHGVVRCCQPILFRCGELF